MKIKGARRWFRSDFAAIVGNRIARGCSSGGLDRPAVAPGRTLGRVAPVCGHAGAVPTDRRALGSGRRVALGSERARADDVAKRRRQGLVVCRAASPFEGRFDARPSVTLAPTLLTWVACQSRTVRA